MTLTEEQSQEQETEEHIEQEENVDAMELSDEAFMKLDGPPVMEEDSEKEEEAVIEKDKETEDVKESKQDSEEIEKEEESILESDDETITNPEKEKEEEVQKETEVDPDLNKEEEPDSKEKKEKKTDKTEKDTFDYKAEYKKITATFKANGHDMTVKNSDDAIRLMQMGANYHKKMAGLKPAMRVLKLLEKNDLMKEENLNFLIDLKNKNPEAITKLVKDSGMDPLDVNTKEDSDYTPTQHTVSDAELALDAVLEDIQATPTYQRTIDVISNVWDKDSRNHLANEPKIISQINEHMADGTYDKVMEAVEYERSLGKLVGVSDLQAYKDAGDRLFAAGQIGQQDPVEKTITDTSTKVKPKSQDDAKRKKRKQAVSPTKSAGTPAVVTYDPLNMSDEDFAKIDPNDFKQQ